MTINEATGEEFVLPDHSDVVAAVTEQLQFFYGGDPERNGQVAFHLVHDVLTVRPVNKTGVYSLFLASRSASLD